MTMPKELLMSNDRNDSANSPENDPLLIDHEADGIKELDNLLPRWWVWLFYLTSIFALVYLVYYHVFRAGDLQASEYRKEAAIGDQIKNAAVAKFESSIATLQPSADPQVVSQGQQ